MLTKDWSLAMLRLLAFIAPLAAITLCGCMVPRSRCLTLETQNRALLEQNRAQLTEIENLTVHANNTVEKLRHAEENLALLEERTNLDQQQLVNYRDEHEQFRRQFTSMVQGHGCITPQMSSRLAEISQRYPSLSFDPQTAIAKLDTDILFDSGYATLKPGAAKELSELAAVVQQPDALDLRLMVVGHTDDRRMAKRPSRDRYPTNFHLSTARAVSVARTLSRYGVDTSRIGVAGFGEHQPIAPNTSPADRCKNRRVELFVLSPDVPVVGWTETMPSVY